MHIATQQGTAAERSYRRRSADAARVIEPSVVQLDAQRAARVAVGLDDSFDAYPAIDPILIADVTGNGDLSGPDAQRIAQEAVGLDPWEIPPAGNTQPQRLAAPSSRSRQTEDELGSRSCQTSEAPVSVAHTTPALLPPPDDC